MTAEQGDRTNDIVVQLGGIVQQFSALIEVISERKVVGSFTMASATRTTVHQPAVRANSIILLQATNRQSASMVGSAKSPYIAVLIPGTGFTIATSNGEIAQGNETFMYILAQS